MVLDGETVLALSADRGVDVVRLADGDVSRLYVPDLDRLGDMFTHATPAWSAREGLVRLLVVTGHEGYEWSETRLETNGRLAERVRFDPPFDRWCFWHEGRGRIGCVGNDAEDHLALGLVGSDGPAEVHVWPTERVPIVGDLSPDGQTLVFASPCEGERAVRCIFRAELDGAAPTEVARTGDDVCAVRFVPGGRRVLLTSGDGCPTLSVLDLRSSELRAITRFDPERTDVGSGIASFTPSPDGARVAVLSTCELRDPGVVWWHAERLYLVDVETGERRRVSERTYGNMGLLWPPRSGT